MIDTKETRPVPDPTDLTTKQLMLAIAALRELLEARLSGIELRITHIEERAEVMAEGLPRTVDEKIAATRSVHEEKFRSIQVQFSERDTRATESQTQSSTAVSAALQAAKEAVSEQNKSSALAIAKSETATTKQIDQQGMLIQTATASLDSKIVDLKERITTIEGKGSGVASSWAVLVAVVGIIMGLIGAFLAVKH